VDEDLACAMYDELVERTIGRGFIQYEVANFARETPQAGAPGPTAENHSAARASRRPAAAGSKPDGNCSDTMNDSGDLVNSATIPAFACRHNVNYWRGGAYHGLGPSAAGYVRGVRTKNIANTQIYCEQLERGRRPIDWREELPPLRRAGETAAFGLRMNAGWPFASFREATGYDLRAEWQPEMTQLVSRGWGALESERFRLTRDGLRFADAAAEMFLK